MLLLQKCGIKELSYTWDIKKLGRYLCILPNIVAACSSSAVASVGVGVWRISDSIEAACWCSAATAPTSWVLLFCVLCSVPVGPALPARPRHHHQQQAVRTPALVSVPPLVRLLNTCDLWPVTSATSSACPHLVTRGYKCTVQSEACTGVHWRPSAMCNYDSSEYTLWIL